MNNYEHAWTKKRESSSKEIKILSKQNKDIKNYQMEILEVKNTITEI